MADSKFFTVPFGATGDRAVIPDATQPGGQVSYQQGFGPDYGRNPASDPLAKRVPRDQTNEYLYQITNALKFIQLYGTPEWYATDDLGATVNYPLSARVRYDAGAGMQAWRSLVANNTAAPGSDATKWALDEAFSFINLEASLTEALAGTLSTKIITPRRLASAVQRGAWNYAVAGGSANSITVNLTPALASYTPGIEVNVKITASNTGPVVMNVSGVGLVPVVSRDGSPLNPGDLIAGEVARFIADPLGWIWSGRQTGQLIKTRVFDTPGVTTYTPTPGTRSVLVELVGGGGQGCGTPVTTSSQISAGPGGGAGGYARRYLTTGFAGVTVTVGAGGSAGGPGQIGSNGGATSFGSLVSATGGGGGNVSGAIPIAYPNTAVGGIGGAASGSGTSGDLVAIGGFGSPSFLFGGTGALSGAGGASFFGAGASLVTGNSSGALAVSPGSGGGGSNAGSAGSGMATGGAGRAGVVYIQEFS